MINSSMVRPGNITSLGNKMVHIKLDEIAKILEGNRIPEKVDLMPDESVDMLMENHAVINNIARDILKIIQVHHNFPTDDFLKACGVDLNEDFSKYK